MVLSRRTIWKRIVAVCFGIPGTLMSFPMALVAMGVAIEGARFNPAEGLLFFGWGVAGLAGLCGFWTWTFIGPYSKTKVRILAAVGIVAGMCAAAPFVFIDAFRHSYVFSAAAALGLVIGGIISVWLVLPNSPLNPDALPDRRTD